MEQLTAALLSCPIPASYALGSGDRDSTCSSEFRSLPRLCAAASLAALEGMSSPSAAADASSSSERTPEMLQERAGTSSSEEALSGCSPTDLLLLQAASKAAAAAAAAANDPTGLLLRAAGGNQQQQQQRLELLRKALREHSISSGTDAYASSSSMSLRSVSTQASSLPDAAASTRRALAHLSSSSAAAGHSFPVAPSLDSSQCSPFSSPSSSASPSVSSPPVSLPSRAAASNGSFVSRYVARTRSPASEAAAAAAQYLLKDGERRPSPSEAIAELCSAAGALSEVDRDALAAAAAAVTAAAAGDVVAAEVQQQQLLSKTAVHGHELPFGDAEGTESPAAEAAAGAAGVAAVDAAANTSASEARATMAAAAAAQMLAKVLADTSAITANGSCVAAEEMSEAAAYALLATAAGGHEGAATDRNASAVSPSHLVSYAAEEAENRSSQQPEKAAAARPSRQRGGVCRGQDIPGEALPSSSEEVDVKGDRAALLPGEHIDLKRTAAPVSNPEALAAAAAAAAVGVEPAAAAAVVRSPTSVAAAGGGFSAASAAALGCSDTIAGDVATCINAHSDPPPLVAAATAVESRQEACGTSDTRAERTARKKRLRDSAAGGSRGDSVALVAAAAAPVSPAAAAAGTADLKRAAAAAGASCEERQAQKEKDSSSGEKTATARGTVHTGSANGEKSHTARKKEKRCAAAGGAAAPVASGIDVRMDACSAAAAPGEMHAKSQEALLKAAAELCVTGDLLRQENEAATENTAANGRGEGSGDGDAAASWRRPSVGSLHEENVATDSTAAVAAAAREVVENEGENGQAAVAKRKHAHEEGLGEGKRTCTVAETKEASREAPRQSETCETSLSEQIGYLAATTYFSGGDAAEGLAGTARGCAERSEQECSTMSCNSRNSSGELLVLSTALSVESVQQEQALLQELPEKQNEEKQRGQVAAGDYTCREVAMAFGVEGGDAGQLTATAAAGDEVSEAVKKRTPEEESKMLSEDSRFGAEETAPAESQTERLREREDETALVQPEQERHEAQQQHQHHEREKKEHQPQQEQEQQERVTLQQPEEQQQQDEEEEEGLPQEAGGCFVGGNESNSASWEKMDDSSSVPPLHAYKSLSWTEGFSLPLGKIGRQKLLRQVRLKYHRNREHWRAKLHEKGFDVTSLPRMGVEQLWAVAQQMDLFDVACIIAHEHATRRQHRGGGGGGGCVHGGAATGQQQQQQGSGACAGGGGAGEAAGLTAGRDVGGRGGGEGDGDAVPTLLSDTTACVEATLSQLPSLVQAGASLRDVCADKALKSALALLADNAAAAAAVPYTCSSAQTEQGERRSGQQRPRGGAAVKESPLVHSMSGSSSMHRSGSPQGRSSRTRCRSRAGESRHATVAAAGGKAAQGRRDAAAEAATAAAEEEGEGGEGAGSTGEMYPATLAAAGTEPTEEEEEEVGGDHPLLLLQEDEGETAEQEVPEDLKESALRLLQQQQVHREELFAEEASTREEDGEGGRSLLAEAEHGIRSSQEEAAAAAALAAAAAAAAERRRTCGLFETEGGMELAQEATAAALAAAAAAAESAASGWPSRGAARRNKKKVRQEPLPSCGNVGELLSKVCAEALREAVACATDVAGRRYNLQTASSSACLRVLGLAEAAAAAESGAAESAAAPAADVEAAAAAAKDAAEGEPEKGGAAAGLQIQQNLREAELREAQIAAAATSCSHLLKNNWTEAEGGLSAFATQQQELQQQRQQRQQRVDVNLLDSSAGEGEICSRDAGDVMRLCAALRQRGEDRKRDSCRDRCRSVVAGFSPSETEELALFLQQQFAASSASSCVTSGRAPCENGELYRSESGGGAAAAETCKERKGDGGLAVDRQEHTYDGSTSNSGGAAPARVSKGRQRSQREKQRAEKDRQRSLMDQRQVRLKEIQAGEEGDDTAGVCRETPPRAEAADVAFAAEDAAAVLGSSRLTSVRMGRLGAASTATVATARSAAEATPLAAAVGDLLWMARGVSEEGLKLEQRMEGLASHSLERETLDEAAATAQNEQERERKEAEELAETRRCMRDALSEIYMHLNNGLRGTMSAPPRAASNESGQKDGAAEGELCCSFSVEAGNRAANATRGATAALAADTGAAQEAPVSAAPVAEHKVCLTARSGRRRNQFTERDWERPFRPEGGNSSGSIDKSPHSGGSSNSYYRVSNMSNECRETVVCGETPSGHRGGGGVGEELYRRKARTKAYLDAQLAERLQQRVNDLQGQLDEVKVQLHQLLKLNVAAETLSATGLADEGTQRTFAAEDAAPADCEARLSLRAEGKYCSRSITGG